MATLKRKSRTPDLPSESVPLVQILIVDDSRTTLRVEERILERALEAHGHSLSTVVFDSAENGKAACEKAHALAQKGLKYDLVLMDLTMPVLDGMHATELLRQYMYHGSSVPILSVSSRPGELDPEIGAAVFSGKFMKPLSAIMANEIVTEFIPSPEALAHTKRLRRLVGADGKSMWVAVGPPSALTKPDLMDSSAGDFAESDTESASTTFSSLPSSSSATAPDVLHQQPQPPSEAAAPWGLHPPGVACVVAGTLNLLGEAFNPFEFLATGDAQFMAHYRELLTAWESLEWKHVAVFIDALLTAVSSSGRSSPLASKVGAGLFALRDHCDHEDTVSLVSFFTEEVLKNDNKKLEGRLNLITFAMKPNTPLASGLDACHGPSSSCSSVSSESRSDSSASASSSASTSSSSDEPMQTQWNLIGPEPEEEDVLKSRWFQELCVHATNATTTSANHVKEIAAHHSYAADPNLLAWDLCCCVLAHLQRPAYLAICAGSHLNLHNAPSVASAFFEAAHGQAKAWAQVEAARAVTAFDDVPFREAGEHLHALPLVIGLQEWPGRGTPREMVFVEAAAAQGLSVLAPSEDVALAFSTHALPKPYGGAAAGATMLRGREAGERSGGELTRDGASATTTTSATPTASSSWATCTSATPIDDGHGSGWAPIALTAPGGWVGAGQQAGSVLRPRNPVRNRKCSSADSRADAATADAATADAATADAATADAAMLTTAGLATASEISTEPLDGPPVIDPLAIMHEVVEQYTRKSKGRHALSDKDVSGLLGTTALKTIVVLLAPPPLQSSSCSQLPGAGLQQEPCGVAAIVVHAKEPKSIAATRCLAAFFARLVAAVKAVTSALKKAQEVVKDKDDDFCVGKTESVRSGRTGDGSSKGYSGRNSDSSSSSSSGSTAATHLDCPAWVVDRVCGAEWSNVTVLSDTNIAKAKLSNGFRSCVAYMGLEARPRDPTTCTTRKRRSMLHGQCFDAAKCHVTVDAPKDVVIAKPGAFLMAINTSATDVDDHAASSFSFSSSSNYWDARRLARPRLPSFSSEDEGTGSQRAVRDGFVLESNGSFDSVLPSFDKGLPPDFTYSSKGSGEAASGGSLSGSNGLHDKMGSSLNVMMVYPPMQLYHGLFGRALPDSAWPSDHCLVTAAIALEPEPTSLSTR